MSNFLFSFKFNIQWFSWKTGYDDPWFYVVEKCNFPTSKNDRANTNFFVLKRVMRIGSKRAGRGWKSFYKKFGWGSIERKTGFLKPD